MRTGRDRRHVHSAGARAEAGGVSTDDGVIRRHLTLPGTARDGATTPEHLLAAALAACLYQSITVAASEQGTTADGFAVRATVGLDSVGVGYDADAELDVEGLAGEEGERILRQARALWPYRGIWPDKSISVRSAGQQTRGRRP